MFVIGPKRVSLVCDWTKEGKPCVIGPKRVSLVCDWTKRVSLVYD